MEVTCKHCGATLRIPDDRVPKEQVISARCSRCREKIEIDTREKSGKERRVSSGQEPSSASFVSKRDQLDAEDEVLEYYEEGVRLALVMGDTEEQRDKIEKHLDAMGFRCVLVDETRKGIGKMRLHHFDLVILPEDLGGVPLDQSPIIHFLNHLSMSVRRQMFVVIVGENFRTMDEMMAFSLSVDFVVNTKDLGRLSMVAQRALAQHERFYKVFMEIYREMGKA